MEHTPELYSIEWWQVLLAGVSTLAIFSFLYRENFFYRFFEHFFIGIATAYGIVFSIREFLWPKVFQPLLGLDRVLFPDGTYSEPYDARNLLYLLPMAFGSLYYFILSRRYNWLAQLVIGFSFGVSAGLSFKGLFVELMPQISDTLKPLYVPGAPVETIQNLVFLFTLLTSMCYFFFTFRRTPGGFIERASTGGRWMLMGCFGAFFGSTIMARMALLVERLDFLIHDWFPLFFGK
ncbi:MAG: hypothetical protein U0136_06940 [Bdellovibrionota bacterium]